MVCRKLVATLITLLACAGARAAPLPATGANVHEGVASCSSSQCHGRVAVDPNADLLLNEAATWNSEDYHSRAYKTLLNPQSKAMAAKLGFKNGAHNEKMCLDCHADNVPQSARGEKFQISDGVGCEACHGGGGPWLKSHDDPETVHADNLAKGMYPTEQPMERARLCLSCHLGTKDKFATHKIMGAGHPRLAFDLEVFTQNQPRHYETDQDYGERKPYIESVNMWLAGLLVSSTETMDLLQQAWFTRPGMIPELSFYQCHACHHPMSKLRWQDDPGGLPPGSVPLNDSSLVLLQSVLDILGQPAAAELKSGIAALHRSSLNSRGDVTAQAKRLQQTMAGLEQSLVNTAYSAAQMKQLRKGIVDRAAQRRYRHYTVAWQAFMAVDTLTIEIGDGDRVNAGLDAWFATLDDCKDPGATKGAWAENVSCEDKFEPLQFAEFARRMQGQL